MSEETQFDKGYAQPEPKKGSWVVLVKETVLKHVYCVGCSREEAKSDPFKDGIWNGEDEIKMVSYEVQGIQSNDDQ